MSPIGRGIVGTLAVLTMLVAASPAALAAEAPAPAQPGESTPVMVVLDASGSMKQADAPGPRIDAAKKAITDLVAALPGTARVGLTSTARRPARPPRPRPPAARTSGS